MGIQQDANRLAVASAGHAAEWQNALTPAEYTGAPPALDAGIAIDALKTLFFVFLREVANVRTAYITIVFDASPTTYDVDIDGNVSNTAPDTDRATTITNMAADILAAAGGVVTTEALDNGSGSIDTVKIVGILEPDYTLVLGITGTPATATLTATIDPAVGNLRVWTLPGGLTGSRPAIWALASGGDLAITTFRGFADRFDTASVGRVYGELYDLLGPGGAETGTGLTYTAQVSYGPTKVPS